jgi:hypothetical protein
MAQTAGRAAVRLASDQRWRLHVEADFFAETYSATILAVPGRLGTVACGRLGPVRRCLYPQLGSRKPQHTRSASGHGRPTPARNRSPPSRDSHQRRQNDLHVCPASPLLPTRRTLGDHPTACRTRLVPPANRRCHSRHRGHHPVVDEAPGRDRTEGACATTDARQQVPRFRALRRPTAPKTIHTMQLLK